MEDIGLREVMSGDAEFLTRLMNEPAILNALHEVPTQLSDWKEAIAAWHEDEDEKGYIVLAGDTPVGWFAVNGLQTRDGVAFLKIAVLLPAYQGRKIGGYVLMQMMDELRAAGFASIALYTDQDNIRAQSCYISCGFHVAESLEEQMSDQSVVARYKMERIL